MPGLAFLDAFLAYGWFEFALVWHCHCRWIMWHDGYVGRLCLCAQLDWAACRLSGCTGTIPIWSVDVYSIFNVHGTPWTMPIPVASWTPLKLLARLRWRAVFLLFQLSFLTQCMCKTFSFCGRLRGRFSFLTFLSRSKMIFGPFRSLVRGLFVKHTKRSMSSLIPM